MLKIYEVDYQPTDNGPIVYIFGRDENRNKRIISTSNFEPYFFVLESETDKISEDLKIEKDFVSIFGDKLIKIYVKNPSNVRELRKIFNKTFEADITFTNRFILDVLSDKILKKEYEYGIIEDFRVFTIDIETRVEKGFPDTNTAKEAITCITLHDSFKNITHTFVWHPTFTKQETTIFENEEQKLYKFLNEQTMLKSIIIFIQKSQPDIIQGWNSISFDLTYFFKRCQNLLIDIKPLSPLSKAFFRTTNKGDKSILEPKIFGVVLIDLLETYKRQYRGEMISYSLASVAKKEKVSIEKKWINVESLWKENWEELVGYNIDDVKITVAIEKKRELLTFLNDVRKFGNVRFDDVKYFSRVVDSILLKKARKDNIILPSKPEMSNEEYNRLRKERNLQGAFVYTNPGLYKNVLVYDFSKLYVSIIRSFNLSPEVIDINGEIKLDEVNISTKKEGIIPSLIEYLLTAREEIDKKLKEEKFGTEVYDHLVSRIYTIKCLILATWGVFSNPMYRLHDLRLAKNITKIGRELTQTLYSVTLKEGYTLAYQDTDSAAVIFPTELTAEQTLQKGELLLKKFLIACDELIKSKGLKEKHYINLDIEKLYKTILVLSKKKYVGYLIGKEGSNGWKAETGIDVVGAEGKKSNYSTFAHQLQADIFDIILKENEPKQKILTYINIETKKMLNNEYPLSYISIPEKLTKDVKDYKITAPRLRGVKWSNQNINTNYKSGSKFLSLFVIHSETDVICFENDEQLVKLNIKINKEKMFYRNVYLVVDGIFKVLNWTKDLENIKFYFLNKNKSLMDYI